MESPVGAADPFDPASLAGPSARLPAGARQAAPRHRAGEKFLKGPVPWDWLDRAGRLPGKALAVALVLWREAGCTKRRTVKFCLGGARAMGLNEQSARRGLRALVGAGLVRVHHLPGHGLEVTLQEAPPPGP
jgi:hypothetical protein